MFAWNKAKELRLKFPTMGANESDMVKMEIRTLLDELAEQEDTNYGSFCFISLKERFNSLVADMDRLKYNNDIMQKCLEDICREDLANDGEEAEVRLVHELAE